MAAGLLHPFTPRGREIWAGHEGFAAAVSLIRRAEAATGARVSEDSGLLRLALQEEKVEELQGAIAAGSEGALEQRWLPPEAMSTSAGAEIGGAVLGAAFAPAALRQQFSSAMQPCRPIPRPRHTTAAHPNLHPVATPIEKPAPISGPSQQRHP